MASVGLLSRITHTAPLNSRHWGHNYDGDMPLSPYHVNTDIGDIGECRATYDICCQCHNIPGHVIAAASIPYATRHVNALADAGCRQQFTSHYHRRRHRDVSVIACHAPLSRVVIYALGIHYRLLRTSREHRHACWLLFITTRHHRHASNITHKNTSRRIREQ